MKYFQEITLIPSIEIPLGYLWSQIYQKIHLGLVTLKNKHGITLGVSFPEYQIRPQSLGKKLRIFAERKEDIEQLKTTQILSDFLEYVHIRSAQPVPQDKIKGYSIYRRARGVKSADRKAKRYAKRHDISIEEAQKIFTKKIPTCKLPHTWLYSLSTRNRFPLSIKKVPADITDMTNQHYGSYGLSSEVAVPEF